MAEKIEKHVLLFTPGVDSYLSNYFFRSMVKSKISNKITLNRVYFELDTIYADNERFFLEKKYKPGYIDYDFRLHMGDLEESNAHVPNRNLLLTTLAQAKYDADVVYISGVKDDRTEDNDCIFRKMASNILSHMANKEVKVVSILEDKEKSEWVKDWVDSSPHNNPLSLYLNTYSCFTNFDIENNNQTDLYKKENNKYVYIGQYPKLGCEKCPACYRRGCVLTAANIYVPYFDKLYNDKYVGTAWSDKNFQKKYPNRCKTINEYNRFLHSEFKEIHGTI